MYLIIGIIKEGADYETNWVSNCLRVFVKEGVEVMFGFPGGQILPFYDTLPHIRNCRHILVRHEQAAAHAADAYARVTGKVGVVRRNIRAGSNKSGYRTCQRLSGFGTDGCDYGSGRPALSSVRMLFRK